LCDPITIAGIALSAGSTVANTIGANKAAAARDDVLAAERIRQNTLDAEAQGLNTASQDRYQGFEGKQEATAKSLGDYFAAPAPAEPGASVMPSATNDVVTSEINKKSDEAGAFAAKQGASLGELRSFGDLLGDTSLLQARDASKIGQIGGFKRGSSNVTPLELDEASQKGAGMGFLGDILGGAGSIATNYGLTRGPRVAGGGGTRPKANPSYYGGV
jgi:hypothetical protein